MDMSAVRFRNWRKSSFSGGAGQCVELAHNTTQIAVRDSKNPTGPMLTFAQTELIRLISALKTDRLSS
ncbi:protein of unknown function (DUF397) [Goodfellowiella coeruleoviolacea]|uniref:DUF397 domain-containing protein n=2 Tax=Goodfellowiella coeruleoviolacea TaxID=334858 RepID=A0AAE3GC63_9PSEU|nr:protein of unknown function (DUF397) [Goodfellowiella coeruleoviolacea]